MRPCFGGRTLDQYEEIAAFLRQRLPLLPRIALVLGSALGSLAEAIEDPFVLRYEDIPGFLHATVASHKGELLCGRLGGQEVLCLSGRFHGYEGYAYEDLALPIRVLHLLGVRQLILTNAAGAIRPEWRPGEIMLLEDHIQLNGATPLRGPHLPEFGPRFFDVSQLYSQRLRDMAFECAEELGIPLRQGVYYFAPGPQFETPAEIRAMRILGGDCVGMSTVPEALAAAQVGMEVAAFSMLSNMAAGVVGNKVSGEEVDEVGGRTAPQLAALIEALLAKLGS
ncbi:Purine nucleoside phosphorylase [Clostridiaceae bacterium JG1575]|nr:Purine nucleoside phosphorylase [Clostridiaceae bacterium JG1575]